MSSYLEFIERARLVETVESCLTTGDVEYPGTALEVTDRSGEDLFHVVVDSKGRRQVLIFAAHAHYRLPLELLEECLARAREAVTTKREE